MGKKTTNIRRLGAPHASNMVLNNGTDGRRLKGLLGQLLGMSLVQKPSLMSFFLCQDTRIGRPCEVVAWKKISYPAANSSHLGMGQYL